MNLVRLPKSKRRCTSLVSEAFVRVAKHRKGTTCNGYAQYELNGAALCRKHAGLRVLDLLVEQTNKQ